MKITKLFAAFLISSLFFSSQIYAQYITGEGNTVTQNIDLETITGIGLGISADVYIKQGAKQEIKIKGQKNIIDNIKTKVRGGSWNIEFDKKVKNYKDLKIYVTLSSIKDLSIGGSGSIIGESKFTNLSDLNLSIGGSGDIKIDVAAGDINCSIGGSGEIELSGSGNELSISIGGSGDIEAYDLEVKRCSVSTAGSGDVNVNVSEKLDVSMVGSGDVSYKGNPKVSSSIVGSGDVEKKG
jgi:Putative auto-transporter adhesin, head GIN domain